MVFSGCGGEKPVEAPPPVPVPQVDRIVPVVTSDIAAGIEKHIEDRSREGDGYFNLNFDGRDLRLKLVRVHLEYLANLGPRSHFACVDLACTDGDVYDVDFFLEGDPGKMRVTETSIHKINGQPIYAWAQAADKTWHRVPVEKADKHLLGVLTDRDEFEFLYQFALPEIKKSARIWLPLPSSDAFQTIEIMSLNAPGRQKVLDEEKHGNKVLFLKLDSGDSGKIVEISFRVERLEKTPYIEEGCNPAKYLDAERFIPVHEDFDSIGTEVVKGKKGDLARARALYDHVIDRMSYKKYGEGWGNGDAVYACDARTGNCTDFHSYFIALARAVGIPARFAIGAAIPSARNEGGINGYHCWAEFYAEGKWWPVDISEGDKYSNLATYYFGHHPANRIELSRGRDLVVKPGPASGPINFLAYPVFESNGETIKIKPEFVFVRKS